MSTDDDRESDTLDLIEGMRSGGLDFAQIAIILAHAAGYARELYLEGVRRAQDNESAAEAGAQLFMLHVEGAANAKRRFALYDEKRQNESN